LSIKLDWQIEAERVFERSGEDSESRAARRRRQVQIVLAALLLIVGLASAAGLVWMRLQTVDNTLRQTLIDTAQAEVASLRIGDYLAFSSLQRSASETWLKYQSTRFNLYQDMKAQNRLVLTGSVVSATVDRQRGRIVLEELRDNTRHLVVWFYWRYEDGWRHVPSDFEFWGDPDELQGKTTTVRFMDLDRSLATELAPKLEHWWRDGCAYVGCDGLPRLTVVIEPEPAAQVDWDYDAPADQPTLRVPSPLAAEDGASGALGLHVTLEDTIAQRIAERIFSHASSNLQPIPTSDAAWLRQAIIEWLAETFTGRVDTTQVGFIDSLAKNYGSEALAALIRSLTSAADIGVLSSVLSQPLPALALDWRPFFQWRLNVEKTLLTSGDQESFMALWDTGNPNAQTAMFQRLQNPQQQTPQIQVVAISAGADGVPAAVIQAAIGDQTVLVTFRLVNGTWKRVG
jgi:hypothetical protein